MNREYIPLQYWLQHICNISSIPLEIDTQNPLSLPEAPCFVQIKGKSKNPMLSLREQIGKCKKLTMNSLLKRTRLSIQLDFEIDFIEGLNKEQIFNFFEFDCWTFDIHSTLKGFSIQILFDLCPPPYFLVSQLILPPHGDFFFHSSRVNDLTLFKRLHQKGKGCQIEDIKQALSLAMKRKSILFVDCPTDNHKVIEFLKELKAYEKKHIILLAPLLLEEKAQKLAQETGTRFISEFQGDFLPIRKLTQYIPDSQIIMVDDCELTHSSWSIAEKKHGIKFLKFFTAVELIDHIHLLSHKNQLHIDSSLEMGLKGEIISKFLKENFEFDDIYLQTSHDKFSFPKMWWITDIIEGKKPVINNNYHKDSES